MHQLNFINDKFDIDELLTRSIQYRSSEGFTRFFDFISRFHHYSRFNTMLVFIQNEGVTFFGSRSFWRKKFSRSVKQDAKPHIILTPKGPVSLVYDIFDTEGNLTPKQLLEKGLGRRPFRTDGTISPADYDKALQKVHNWGIRIRFEPMSYFKGGHITTIRSGELTICLNKDKSREENTAILVHELAHLFLGHTGHKQIYNSETGKNKVLPVRLLRNRMEEMEAETVSHLVCHKMDLHTNSLEYIAGYIQSEEDMEQFSYETVIRTADMIERTFF